jgi:tRNA G10  N-methylase Trm11
MQPAQLPMVFVFRARFGDSRLKEVESLAHNLNHVSDSPWPWNHQVQASYGGDIGPSLVQNAPLTSDYYPKQLATMINKSISCRGVFFVLGHGKTLSDCVEKVRDVASTLYDRIDGTWCIRFLLLGRKGNLHPTERLTRIEAFADVIDGLTKRSVDLNNPKHELWLVEDYRTLYNVKPTHKQAKEYWLLQKINPYHRQRSGKDLATQLQLTKRPFLNTTTMPAQRALIMAHLACAGKDQMIVDPFCGSGSLLLAAAALGAKTVGSDLAVDLLSSRKRALKIPASIGRPHRGIEKVCIYDNFDELNLKRPILISGLDASSEQTSNLLIQANQGHKYHAILTDPPYGIRESSTDSHVVITQNLMNLGKRILVQQGRLVFLLLLSGHGHEIAKIDQIQRLIYSDLGQKNGFTLFSFGLAKFNAKQLRATLVFIKSE